MSQVHVSHTNCKHAKTPKERAKCRRVRRNGAPEMTKDQVIVKIKKTKKIDNEDELPEHKVFSSNHNKVMPVQELLDEEQVLIEACERDDAPEVQVNVIAKGSKVVHKPFLDGAEDGTYLFTCTKKVVNIETATITSAAVTCKNCLKVK